MACFARPRGQRRRVDRDLARRLPLRRGRAAPSPTRTWPSRAISPREASLVRADGGNRIAVARILVCPQHRRGAGIRGRASPRAWRAGARRRFSPTPSTSPSRAAAPARLTDKLLHNRGNTSQLRRPPPACRRRVTVVIRIRCWAARAEPTKKKSSRRRVGATDDLRPRHQPRLRPPPPRAEHRLCLVSQQPSCTFVGRYLIAFDGRAPTRASTSEDKEPTPG